MIVTIKNVRTWKGTDGLGFQATLVVDGVSVAEFTDEGSGGAMRWNVFNRDRFVEFARSHDVTNAFVDGYPLTVRCDTRIDLEAATLVDDWETRKRLKRLCRTLTVFTLPSDPDAYLTIKRQFSPDVKAAVLKKHPDAVIVNESL